MQGRSVRVSHVDLANILKTKKQKSSILFSWYSVTPHTPAKSGAGQINCIVSQLQPPRRCYSRDERKHQQPS